MPVSPFDPIYGADPTPEEREFIARIRAICSEARSAILMLPQNRERALALTHLEDTCMRATRAVLMGNSTVASGSSQEPARHSCG